MNPYDLLREPFQSEMDYFDKNRNVTGMATEDNKIILNPYSKLNEKQKDAVIKNEATRILIRTGQVEKPIFDITEEQGKFLDNTTYKNASEDDRKATIAARLLTGDSSGQTATEDQMNYISKLSDFFNKDNR
jgi:hypothetical protein